MRIPGKRWNGAIWGVLMSAMATGWASAEDEGVREKRPGLSAEQEKKILTVLEDLHENQRRGMMNVPPSDGRLLRVLTQSVGARHVVEIGTSNGYSGIWFCLGLRATGGKLTTYEIDAGRANLARENFKRAGVTDLVTLVEGDAHEEVTKLRGAIDILFLDADKQGYIDYLDKLRPLMRNGGLILAHNTTDQGRWMQDYLKAVTTDPDLETIFLHERDRGIGVTLVKRGGWTGSEKKQQAAGESDARHGDVAERAQDAANDGASGVSSGSAEGKISRRAREMERLSDGVMERKAGDESVAAPG